MYLILCYITYTILIFSFFLVNIKKVQGQLSKNVVLPEKENEISLKIFAI